MEYALLPASDMPEIVVELIETVDEAGRLAPRAREAG